MAVAFCASSSRTQELLQSSPAHKGERGDFDHAGLHAALDGARVHEILERVIDRTQIRIDFFPHVAGQEAQPFAGLDGGARQDQALDHALLQQGHGMADGEPGLAGAGRPRREHQLMALQFAHIEILRRRPGAHRSLLARRNLLEGRARAAAFAGKEIALQGAFLDRAIDIAHGRRMARARPRPQNLQHPPGVADRVRLALDDDMIAIGVERQRSAAARCARYSGHIGRRPAKPCGCRPESAPDSAAAPVLGLVQRVVE